MRHVALAILLIVVPLPASAVGLEPGARVRVTLLERHDAPTVVGNLLALPPGAIEVQTAPDVPATTIQRLDVARLEISRGMKDQAGRGAVRGAILLGVVAGVGALVIDSSTKEGDVDEGTILGIGVLGGAAVGALLGALIGSGQTKESWERVPVP